MSQANQALTADISLILCTYGRVNEVNVFLESIHAQTIKPAEIIIVDQNEKEIVIKTILSVDMSLQTGWEIMQLLVMNILRL